MNTTEEVLQLALTLLAEAKEVLLQLDTRHNGKCYNPCELDCHCTICKINEFQKNNDGHDSTQ